jgi:RNA polymerase sigma factor (sigma-70 family)
MRKEQRGAVLSPIRALYSVGTFAGLGDGQLIERFIQRQGEGAELAFAALVERHGPMVFRVCRRFLRDSNDAQDAFQATFLILVRKAGALRDRGSVGSWLHGVAARVCRDARAASDRRRRHEKQYAAQVESWIAAESPGRQDLERAVHDELERLPERYREPLVLCCLEGLSHEEAARRLDRPLGTIRSRLARGRDRLRSGLARRGYLATGAAFATALSTDASAMVPESLFDLTVRSAARVAARKTFATEAVSASVAKLIQGSLRSMFMTKVKYAFALLTAIGVTTTAGVNAHQEPKTPFGGPPSEQGPAGGGPRGVKASSRVAAAEEHLEHTKKQVDDAVTDLRAEVEDLRARLQQAQTVLARMEALQSALGTNPNGFAPAKGDLGLLYGSTGAGQRQAGAFWGRGSQAPGKNDAEKAKTSRPHGSSGASGSGPFSPGMPGGYGSGGGNKADQGKAGAFPSAGTPGQNWFEKGTEKATTGSPFAGSANAQGGSGAGGGPTDRRAAIEAEIQRLTRERDKLDAGSGDQPKPKGM